MTDAPAVFRAPDRRVVADTCEPLRAAAERGEVDLSAWVHGTYPGRRLPADVLAEVATIGSWDARTDQTWGLDWHYNEGIEFMYLDSGRVDYGCGQSSHHLDSGALTVTAPWQRHSVGRPHITSSRVAWLILDVGVRYPNQDWSWPEWLVCSEEDLRAVEQVLRTSDAFVWRADEDVRTAFRRIIDITQSPWSARLELRLKLHINALLVAFLEMIERHGPPEHDQRSGQERAVEVFLDRLSERLDERWSVDSMAAECGLRRSRFAHYCRLMTNMTPAQYLMTARVDAAAALLAAEPDCPVTDIAYRVGFSSGQHLATAFRTRLGTTPTAYRLAVRPGCGSEPVDADRGDAPAVPQLAAHEPRPIVM